MIRSRLLAGAAVCGLAVAGYPLRVAAQLPAPAASATPPLAVTIPTPLPTLTPTPPPTAAPQPAPTGAVVPPPITAPAASPTLLLTRVRQVPTAPVLPTPTATPFPAPTPATTAPAPAPAASSPVPAATPTIAPAPDQAAAGGSWRYAAGTVGLIAALAALAWAFRRRREREEQRFDADQVPDDAVAAPAAPPPSAAAALPSGPERARLTLAAAPRRAGVNLLTATVDLDVTVENIGTLPARAVALAATLTSAGVEQDRRLAALFAGPPGRAAVAPFDLAPGERRTVRVLVTLPRSAIVELNAGARPMFVPVVALDARYDSGAGDGQVAQALAVGVERPGAAKLAPFWLDSAPRMFEAVAARAHGLVVER